MEVDASFWWNYVSIPNGYLSVLNGYGSIFFWLTWKIQDAEITILRNLKKTNQKRTGYVSILNGGFSVLQGASLFQFFSGKK